MATRKAAEAKQEESALLHPKLAEHLIAHAQLEKQLLAMVSANRLPHTILVSGPPGIGKATLGYRLARFLLARQETGDSLFGEAMPPETLHLPATHPTFRRVAAGAHPDFLVLEGDDIKVEEARSVAGFLSLTPAESDWRVVLIDSADALNRNAANALLKTLEEPPARAVLVLISHNPGQLLPTIRSRCRTLRAAPLEPLEFARVMAQVAPGLSPAQVQSWALLSGGSPGVALTLRQSRADALYRDLLERLAQPDTLKNHAFAERFVRKDAATDWKVLTRLFMWLLARVVSGMPVTEICSGERSAIDSLRNARPIEFWLDLSDSAARLFRDTDNLHLDKKQALLMLLREV